MENKNKNADEKDSPEKRHRQLDRYNENKTVCFDCFGSGFVYALLKSDLTFEYVFSCSSCSASQILKYNFPVWNKDKLGEKYEILKIGQLETFKRQSKMQHDFYLSKSVNIKPNPEIDEKLESPDW